MGSLARVVVAVTMAVGAVGGTALAQPAGGAESGPPCAGCVALTLAPQQLSLLPAAVNGLQILVDPSSAASDLGSFLDFISQRGGRPGVVLRAFDPLPPASALALVSIVLLDARDSAEPFDALVFTLRTAATGIRAAADRPPRIVLDPPAAFRPAFEALTRQGYWDAVVGGAGAEFVRGGVVGGVEPILNAAARGSHVIVAAGPDADVTRAALAGLALAARWLAPSLIADDSGLRIACGGAAVAVWRDPVSLGRVAILPACPESAMVTLEPSLPVERHQLSAETAIVRVAEPAGDRFAENAAVTVARRLTVDEIVSRHQAAAARQAGRVRSLISAGTLTVTFEAPGFPAPVTIASATTVYTAAGRTDLEQRDIRVNGIAFRGRGTPKLPIIEPERVAAPPLSITLGERYRYRLAGEDDTGGVHAYVIAFEPVDGRITAFRGRAWIAADDFGVVRIEARQTALRGPVVASEQTDDFTRAAGVWVLARSEVRQLYEGAAYRTPIHRVLALASHDVNPADFESRRLAAYGSDHTMLRDTPAGYRYVERAAHDPGAGPAQPRFEPAARPGAKSRVRTIASGVIVDPNISAPLPFAGLSYLDFDLFGTGTQFNGFFGGSYGQLAFSVPSLHGTRWQLAGRAFGIASSFNDRMFEAGREQYGRNLRQRPAAASLWLVRPLTARVAVRVGYDLDYTALARTEVTASDFTTPRDQIAHGLRVEITGQRGGWEGSGWWVGSRRTGWRRWGGSGTNDYRTTDGDFQRFGASLGRAVALKPRLVARVEATAMGGHDLDRFSRYAFGTFDNRLHGYPAALIRYDGGLVGRGVLGWSAGRFVRLDGFADTAFVHDPGFARGVSRFTGLGAALEAPAPFGTLIAAEWAYGIQGVNADGKRGTHVLRVSAYKVF